MDSKDGERSWTGYVVPAVVTLLLGIQFFLGFQGFDEPHGGLLGLLEAPGALLGWGGVVVLAVLLGWLIAGLVGRDLFGLQGPSGLVVRLVGCVALGFALSGVVGLLGGAAAGGQVGAGIGRLLQGTLGTVPGLVLLVLMAIPALVLAISPFFTTGPATGRPGDPVSRDALAELEPKPGLYEGGTHQPKPLYPPRRFDEDGNEIPMSFDARDVGPVRYADEEPEEGARPAIIKPDPVPMGDDEALADGVRFADEGDSEDEPAPDAPEGVEAGDVRIPLADGVRYADEDAAPDDDEPAEGGEETDADEEAEAEPEDEDEDEEEIEEEPVARAAAPEAPRVVPAPVTRAPPPDVRGADALEQLQDEDEGARYRAKLEGSGIFDEPSVPPPPEATSEEDEEDEVEAQPKRKAPGRKKKAAPEKKAARKPATKKKAPAKKKAKPKKTAAAKKKATPRKQAATTKTKATPKKKAAAAKAKPAPKKKTVKKEAAPKAPAAPAPAPEPEPEATPPVEAPPRRKGAGAKGPEDPIYRKAVEVAMERRAASSVLLSRRLGIGYAQARALIELLVRDGILGEMTPSGSRPLLVTEEEWEARKG